MHEHARVGQLLSKSYLIIPTFEQTLHQGVAPPGLTYLTQRGKAKASVEETKHDAMHMFVCLITLNVPLIICDLLIYPSIVRKRCYTARTRRPERNYVLAA